MVIISNGNAFNTTWMLPPWKMYTPKMQTMARAQPTRTNMLCVPLWKCASRGGDLPRRDIDRPAPALSLAR